LAVAAALDTAAKDIRFASTADDFEEDVEFSRLTSLTNAPNDPYDFADGASETNDALLMLDGLGGNDGALFVLMLVSEIFREGCGVRS
jgi:hypothetical protein